ncbi:HIR complex subunit [Friedmanniomyces endolithicus]|uniref:HIR complex subunit n=1 Tax=Friedmanniomyces endolithicus TaxID=329885 RepID=A0AAN6FMU9_9PEZI|nr:HIR complex subunit [Friedmanniomyces endolithicus]KAK0997434.1 HIR complex subunit [Friedmanniomyces endolithicus]
MAMPLGFAHTMQVDEAASDQSSSSLSPPPPITPQHSDTIKVAAHPPLLNPHTLHLHEGVTKSNAATSALASKAATRAPNGTTSTTVHVNGTAPEKPKRQRKKKEKEFGPDGKPIDDGMPKKTRKPREPKDKTAASTTGAPRAKKQKIEEKLPRDAPATTRQPMLTEMVGMFQHPIMQHTTPSISSPQQHRPSLGPPTSNPPTPRPISSGQKYDPVRGYDPVRAATMETRQQRPTNLMNGIPSAQTSPHVNRASASPSIASLIDPPMASATLMPAPSHYPLHSIMQPASIPPLSTQPPTPPKPAPAFPHPPRPQSPLTNSTLPTHDGVMDIDITCEAPKNVPEIKAPSKTPSSGPTPKPARPTPPPAPKGTGSGLLSGSNLFGGPSTGESTERLGVNIDIHIPLNPAGGNTVNIAHEIAKKYGRDAINPRAAAHREELLRIAAAANKIEDISADDNMSVDLMSDLGDDSNMEMGGVLDDEKSGTGVDGKAPAVRRRRRKVEEYDKEDDFIDDTEMAWQEQAAVAKDGFFVYSGPLIPPGETANVESAAPAGRGSGRGRGRGGAGGRGSRGGAGGAGVGAAVGEKSKDPNAPATRGRARGGRGTGAPRKARTTKAERERIEMEKVERERGGQPPPPPPSSGGSGATPAVSAVVASSVMTQPRPMGYGGPAQGTVA